MYTDRPRTKKEKQLASLVRERQRLWGMLLYNANPIRITVEVGGVKTVLRQELCYSYGYTPHGIVHMYEFILNKEIERLTAEVVADARAEQQQQSTNK